MKSKIEEKAGASREAPSVQVNSDHLGRSDSPALAKALREVRRSEIELRTIVNYLPGHAWCCREDGYNIFCNQQLLDYTGFSQETARGWSWRDLTHPDDVILYDEKLAEACLAGASLDCELRMRRYDGEYRWFLIRSVPVRDEDGNIVKWFGTNTDIDDRKKAEALLAAENRILQMVASGDPLAQILEEVCRTGDSLSADSMASLLLVDSSDCLRFGAGHRFPHEFLALVDGMKIGPRVGSCGTAAYRKQQVIVTDIETDPLWQDFRELASRYGLRAGWSTPILSADGAVLGVFGMYWSVPRDPSAAHLDLIDKITRLASIAIERARDTDARRASEKVARGQAEALTQALDALARETDPDRILEHVLRTVAAQMDADSASVWLRDADSRLMVFKFGLEDGKFKTKAEPAIAAITPTLPMQAIPQWRDVFRTGKPSVMEDIREGPEFPWRDHVLARGIVTFLWIPILVAGKVEGVIGVRFTEKRAFRPEELELAQSLANQAMLAIQLSRLSGLSRQTAIIEERNRMARDIHDTLAQGFTGVILNLEAAEEAMSRGRAEVVSGHLRSAGEIAREGLREARRSVQALRPLALEEQNLAEALEKLVMKLTAGTSVRASFVLEGVPFELPLDWSINVLRIQQEALTNVLRHARASELEVLLIFDDC